MAVEGPVSVEARVPAGAPDPVDPPVVTEEEADAVEVVLETAFSLMLK